MKVRNNPGFWYNPNGNAADESDWWQQPPPGFGYDPDNPGWAFRIGGDTTNDADWWQNDASKAATPAPAAVLREFRQGVVAGKFASAPTSVILHGSRSGSGNNTEQEYQGTSNYAMNEPGGLGWNATIGDGKYCMHMNMDQWGWNARGASQKYLGVEFAQATADLPISDAQVEAFCAFFAEAKKTWPNLGTDFPTHAELPEGIADGKSDVFPIHDPRADELRARIMARLGFR